MFVSNSDNLGAVMNMELLETFASSGDDFMMEVSIVTREVSSTSCDLQACTRTSTDKKGGHIAMDKRTGKLILREVRLRPCGVLHAVGR